MIEPALSAEEWKDISGDEGFGLYEEFPNSFRSPFAAWFESTHGAHMEVSQHALAALALHGQPFGFTREDVEFLARVIDGDYDGMDLDYWVGKAASVKLDSIRARIAALLPPEKP